MSASLLLQQAQTYSPKLKQMWTPTALGTFLRKHGAKKRHGEHGSLWTLSRKEICERGAQLYGRVLTDRERNYVVVRTHLRRLARAYETCAARKCGDLPKLGGNRGNPRVLMLRGLLQSSFG